MFSLISLAALLSAGCSSKNETPGGASDADAGEGGVAPPAGSFEVNADKGACGASRPVHDEYCQGCTPTQSCDVVGQRPYDNCCVLLREPRNGTASPLLVRTGDTKEYAGTGDPDVSCFEPGHYPTAKTPGKATMKGVVKIFANGCESKNVAIEVWTVKRNGGADDGKPDQLIGQPVITTPDGEFETETVDRCSDPRKDFKFTYPDVPTYTELLIKTYGAKGTDGEQGWATLWDYNQYIAEGDPEFDAANGVYEHNVRALASSDYQTIPTVAFGRTITPGNGAVAGEIHDCGNIRLQNAVADVNQQRAVLTYFSDNEDNPLPSADRSAVGSTGRLALYAALDVAPGPVRVSAVGLVEDKASSKSQLVSLGYFDAQVFPDAVTAVSLRGARPFQIK
jgi:hypothetical protein